jgi:hypothetical protein
MLAMKKLEPLTMALPRTKPQPREGIQPSLVCLFFVSLQYNLLRIDEKSWEPHLLQFLELVRSCSTLTTSHGDIKVGQRLDGRLELYCVATDEMFISEAPLTIAWEPGKTPQRKLLYSKCVPRLPSLFHTYKLNC